MNDDNLRLLHIGFHNFNMTEEITAALAKTFDIAKGWMRYTPNCWVLWTDESPDDWHTRIAATPGLPKNYGALILTILDGHANRGGKTYEWTWKWLQEKK
jgi:hypothetical protein